MTQCAECAMCAEYAMCGECAVVTPCAECAFIARKIKCSSQLGTSDQGINFELGFQDSTHEWAEPAYRAVGGFRCSSIAV